MNITFLGHAAFLIETAKNRVITDPYSSEIGYLPVNQIADFVTISHDNAVWHSCLDDIQGDFELIKGLETLENSATRGEISFGSVLAYERENEGPNAMIWVESEGIRVLHMGDCGVLPDDETLQKCGRVDVLLALAGGNPTLNLDDLMVLIEKLSPKLVIPMHFGLPGLQMKALGIEAIEERFDARQIVLHESSNLELSCEDLAQNAQLQTPQLHVLVPLRAQK